MHAADDDLNEAEVIRALIEAGYTGDEITASTGMGALVAEYLDWFQRSPEARAYGAIAERKGLPLSEVVDRWSKQDVAADIAWTMAKALDQDSICPSCGTRHADMWDPKRRRALRASTHKVQLYVCPIEDEIRRANESLRDEQRERGFHYRLRRREPGETGWIDRKVRTD